MAHQISSPTHVILWASCFALVCQFCTTRVGLNVHAQLFWPLRAPLRLVVLNFFCTLIQRCANLLRIGEKRYMDSRLTSVLSLDRHVLLDIVNQHQKRKHILSSFPPSTPPERLHLHACMATRRRAGSILSCGAAKIERSPPPTACTTWPSV